MRSKIGVLPIALIGFVVIAFTVTAFFLLGVERTQLHILALVFLLISEAILFSGLIGINSAGKRHSRVFIRTGLSVTLFGYFFATLISIVFTSSFNDRVNAFVLMELAIILIFVITAIMMLAFSRRIATDDSNTIEARRFMDFCESRIGNLIAEVKNKDYTPMLNSIYESIKYSDKIGASSFDTKLDHAIARLETSLKEEQKSKEEIDSIFNDVSAIITSRKAEIGQSKRGGF